MAYLNVLIIFLVCIYVAFFRRRSALRLPPGPRPLPLVGNILNLPPKDSLEYRHWLKLKDIHGPIMSVSVLGWTLIILHDRQAVQDLMTCGYGDFLPLLQYGEKFNRRRKIINRTIGTPAAAAQFNVTQQAEVAHFLSRVIDRPDALFEHLQTEASAVILKMTYGYSIETKKPDPLIHMIERMASNMSVASVPLSWMVDIVPALRYLPEWFPGASFKKTARAWRLAVQDVVNAPYQLTQEKMATQSHRPSFVSNLIQQLSQDGTSTGLESQAESDIKWSAATMFLGGAESTVSTMSSFLLAMIKFPEVQRQGQDEIDRVVGSGRLPSFEDRVRLPFVDAIVKEVHRWSPVAPMGLPHVTTEHRVYNGYDIAEGALLVPAVWWLLHDPEVYRDPSTFDPSRFIAPRNEPDPSGVAFGLGRRACPGRYVTDAGLYLLIVQTLAVFTISNAVDQNGENVEVHLQVAPGIHSKVMPFEYKIVPRSPSKVEMVQRAAIEYANSEGESDRLRFSEGILNNTSK